MGRPYNSVELASLVPLALAAVVFGLACAELTEVLRGTRHYIFEELKGNATEGFPYFRLVLHVT